MKRLLFSRFIGVAAISLLSSVGGNQVLASTSISLYSDAQTYVISDSSEANSNYYGKGAMMISAPVTDPSYDTGTVARSMNALFSFNTAGPTTYGSSTSYVTNPLTAFNVASDLNGIYGQGQWTITSITMTLASNYYVQNYQPNNNAFNEIASGNFIISTLSGNPGLSSVTWNSLQSSGLLSTATSDGTFTWTAQPAGTSDNTSSEPAVTYSLNVTPALVSALLSGEIYFAGTAADSQVGYLFNTANRIAPEITITADPLPIPSALLLLGPGLAGLAFVRKRVFGG